MPPERCIQQSSKRLRNNFVSLKKQKQVLISLTSFSDLLSLSTYVNGELTKLIIFTCLMELSFKSK